MSSDGSYLHAIALILLLFAVIAGVIGNSGAAKDSGAIRPARCWARYMPQQLFHAFACQLCRCDADYFRAGNPDVSGHDFPETSQLYKIRFFEELGRNLDREM
jgi:hypothetical protein